MHHVHYFIIE